MTEVQALLKIAEAIEHLAREVGWIGTILTLMAIFKNMGGKS